MNITVNQEKLGHSCGFKVMEKAWIEHQMYISNNKQTH